MRLVDLDPRWIGEEGRIVGITFACPVHPESGRGCYQGVFFANPADGGPPTTTPQRCLWQRTGETFEDLVNW
jgi:hypothetical protein